MSDRDRDELVKRAKNLAADLEEMVEEIEAHGQDLPTYWSSFDVRRTTIDLKTAHVIVADVARKLAQVGTWSKGSR